MKTTMTQAAVGKINDPAINDTNGSVRRCSRVLVPMSQQAMRLRRNRSYSQFRANKQSRYSDQDSQALENSKGVSQAGYRSFGDQTLSTNSEARGGLQLPVIVPQGRPENKSRGWMLCYAPMLASCDISQTEFLDFFKSFNESSKVRKECCLFHMTFSESESVRC